MAGKRFVAIGVKQILYGEPISEKPQDSNLTTLFTGFKEVSNVHQATFEYVEETGSIDEYKNQLNGQTYASKFNAGTQNVNWTIGQYDFEEKKEFMGGEVLEDGKGWERGSSGIQNYKTVVIVTEDDMAFIFPKANVIGRGGATEIGVGIAVTVTPLDPGNGLSAEYNYDVTGKVLKGA